MKQKNAPQEKRNLLNMLPSEAEQLLRAFAVDQGEKAFRGSQVARHLWQSPVDGFARLTEVVTGVANGLNSLTDRVAALADRVSDLSDRVDVLAAEQRQTNIELKTDHRRLLRLEDAGFRATESRPIDAPMQPLRHVRTSTSSSRLRPAS